MANASIYNAFERFWQHIVAALGNKADKYVVTNLSTEVENLEMKVDDFESESQRVCKKRLVWQNSAPNASFPPQSIAVIDDSPYGFMFIDEYDGIEVVFTNGDGMLSTTGVLPTTTGQFYLFSPYDTTLMGMCMRKVVFAENSISFETGYYNKEGTIKVDNVSCIPYRIYLIIGGNG